MNELPLAKTFMLIEPGPVTLVGIGTCSGAGTDKFRKFGQTPVTAAAVKAPLIARRIANIGCRVVDHVKRYDLFVLEGVRA